MFTLQTTGAKNDVNKASLETLLQHFNYYVLFHSHACISTSFMPQIIHSFIALFPPCLYKKL